MRISNPQTLVLTLVLSFIATGCAGEDDAGGQVTMNEMTGKSPVATERGGTISVGEDSWTIIPSVQCSVYPGGVVNIAGHAAEDPSLEITIDHGGPNQIVVGSGRDALWHAQRDTINIEVDGQHVRGTATFRQYSTGTGESREGSFDVQC